MIKINGLIFIAILITGCNIQSNNDVADLVEFLRTATKSSTLMDDKVDLSLNPFDSFKYTALNYKNPFELTLPQKVTLDDAVVSDKKPNFNRLKQPLESYPIEDFIMVGTFKNSGEIWGLIKNNSRIYKVSKGGYIGKNHGRITEIKENSINFIELIPINSETWVERKRSIVMQ